MLNPQRNATSNKRKFETSITTLTLFLCVFGLLGISIISFFQTLSAFEPLNDPEMTWQGISFGSLIAFLFALVFQYGQNAALYIKNTYATGKVFIVLFGKWKIKDTTLCWLIFWICAVIDAGTNCLWLYNQSDVRKQHPIFQAIEYAAMIMIVGVEEVLGITLQAFFHSFTNLRQIIASERIIDKKPVQTQSYQKPPANNSSQTQKPKDKPSKREEYQRMGTTQQQPSRPNNNKLPAQPTNPFFLKDQKNDKSQQDQNGQSGKYMKMLAEKQRSGNTHPYEHSGDDIPNWNDN